MVQKKCISVVIPCYNEEHSVIEMYDRLIKVFEKIPQYDYEIIFSDDCSPDGTWDKIIELCQRDPKVKGSHNVTNFGAARNIYETLKLGVGDAVFMLMGDLQQPPEYLLEFLPHWEEGTSMVIGAHQNTETIGLSRIARKFYYKIMSKISGDKIIPNFNGFGLFDKVIIDAVRCVKDNRPYFPGVIAEYAGSIKEIDVHQENSARGATGVNFLKRYDFAMLGLTSYTRIFMRTATFTGVVVGIFGILFSIHVFIQKLLNWDSYPLGIPSVLIGIFFFGAVQLFFMGIMGEYILSINERCMGRPLIVTDKQLNFNNGDGQIE